MYFDNQDISLYYEKYGEEKEHAILLLPGWGDTRKTFHYLLEELQKEHTIYIFDYPGFGNTKFPHHDLTIYDYALLIKAFVEKEELKEPILIGHSFGGRIAILLAGYYHLPISKIILLDSAGILPTQTFYQKIKNKIYRILKKLGTIFPKKQQKKYLEWLLQKFGSSDYRSLPIDMRKTFQNVVKEDLFPYLKEINAPTLLIWGEKDATTPFEDGKKMKAEISDSGLVLIEGTGHFPYLENPYYVYKIIRTFLT